MPCMENAVAKGQEARMMSILHPGSNAPIDADDLGLKKNFTVARAAKQAPTYNDNFVKVCGSASSELQCTESLFRNTPKDIQI